MNTNKEHDQEQIEKKTKKKNNEYESGTMRMNKEHDQEQCV